MASDIGDLQQQLLRYIATIPKDVNPYLNLADFIKDTIVPRVPQAGLIQLYLFIVSTAVLFILSILVRVHKGIFWLFQLSHSPTLIRPHFSLCWSSIAVVMLGCMIGYVCECIHLFKQDLRPRLGYWFFNIWVLPNIGGATAAWSLGVSYLAHLNASGRKDITRWARCSNLVGLLFPPVYLATVLPLGLTAGRSHHDAVSTYLQIDQFLRNAATSWTHGQSLNVLALTPALPLVDKLVAQQADFVAGWKRTFIVHDVFTFILVGTLTAIAGLYLTSLRRRIKRTAQELHGTAQTRGASLQIRHTYSTLQMTIGAFIIIGIVFVSVASYAAGNPDSLQDSTTCQILVLGPLYPFALLGPVTGISLLWRALEAPSADGSRQGESADASGSGGGRSRQRKHQSDAQQYSIELGGRGGGRAAVNVTVDVLVKEEGGLEKWDTLSEHKSS
ncbi:uncharacterized protein JCM15063_001148 [Sporobolomyces koalae]|uniref:uncharacterized protein n=1 Tax=Sporobolomyces koalae TaxID=500713 RepID=UPI003180B2B8